MHGVTSVSLEPQNAVFGVVCAGILTGAYGVSRRLLRVPIGVEGAMTTVHLRRVGENIQPRTCLAADKHAHTAQIRVSPLRDSVLHGLRDVDFLDDCLRVTTIVDDLVYRESEN